MERDANLGALERHLSGEEQYERIAEQYIDSIIDDLEAIQDIVDRLYKEADNYEGYDMTEELKIALKDLI